MKEPSKKRKEYIDKLPSVYTEVDFIEDLVSIEDRLYWFQKRRIEAWLLKDIRYVVEKGESIFGLAALIFIGIETLSCFAYGDSDDSNDPKHPSKRFPTFLEKYVDNSFNKIRQVTLDFKNGRRAKVNPKDSEIFYNGMRNSLMHSFSFRWAELRFPMAEFKRWEPQKKVLKIDSRKLLVKFEDSVHKYMRDLWKSGPEDYLYENFRNRFEYYFVT